jgi:diacylglycerol kinase (ATP)
VTSVGVIVNTTKTLGGGPEELRRVLADAGVVDPVWHEVTKSKQAQKRARRAVDDGTDLLFVWGGDGMVRRCIHAVAGSPVDLAIVPAGTANLLAKNLRIPEDIGAAVEIGLNGARRALDVGVMNGERFAVMGGTGLDAVMIRDAGTSLKDRVGNLGYVWTGAKHLRDQRRRVRIRVDGTPWFKGKAGCVLVGNVGRIVGGLTIFTEASPDDGRLEIGVITAKGLLDWGRALGRTVTGAPERSPFVEVTSGRSFDIRLDRKQVYELDGGDRPPSKRLRVSIEPAAITIRVPEEENR